MAEWDEYVGRMVEIIRANRGDGRQCALGVRRLTREALARDSFLVACVDRILSPLEAAPENWRNPPLQALADPAVLIRVFYWPPGRRNDPHLHDAWTVTGVLHNEIVVETYKETDTALTPLAGLTPTRFSAQAGDTGYLLPPCVHCLHNPSNTDTATFHVFSMGEQHAKGAGGADMPRHPAPPVAPVAPELRRRALRVMAALLERVGGPSTVERWLRIFPLAGPAVKLQVVKALLPIDLGLAREKSRELESALCGSERATLSRINAALAAA